MCLSVCVMGVGLPCCSCRAPVAMQLVTQGITIRGGVETLGSTVDREKYYRDKITKKCFTVTQLEIQ